MLGSFFTHFPAIFFFDFFLKKCLVYEIFLSENFVKLACIAKKLEKMSIGGPNNPPLGFVVLKDHSWGS